MSAVAQAAGAAACSARRVALRATRSCVAVISIVGRSIALLGARLAPQPAVDRRRCRRRARCWRPGCRCSTTAATGTAGTMSSLRVLAGFLAAMLIGIPFGLAMAISRTVPRHQLPGVRGPAADPAARLGAGGDHLLADAGALDRLRHLPRRHSSPSCINVIGGARSIDVRYFQAARSMGSSHWDIFRRIILPGALPSIVVGCDGRHGHHLERGGRGGDDLRRRRRDQSARRRRAGLLHLELLRRRLLPADRRRHDQHRHRRLHLERASCAARRAGDALAAGLR